MKEPLAAFDPPAGEDWPAIRTWRKDVRAELLRRRLALTRQERARQRARIVDLLARHGPADAAVIGFCWPFKAEIDLRGFIQERLHAGARAALPVVVAKGKPLEFREWRPGMTMQPGIWDIPVPAEGRPLRPDVLLVPLVGFDQEGFRLGYGGGYFDRTLAAVEPRPLAIGVGFELGRLATIHPQPHDVPMDAIVTERGFQWLRRHSPQETGASTTAEIR